MWLDDGEPFLNDHDELYQRQFREWSRHYCGRIQQVTSYRYIRVEEMQCV